MRRLSCQACGGSLSADAIDRRLAVISCNHCGAIFDLTRARAGDAVGAAPEEPPARAPAALPAKFEVDDDGVRLTVRWRWFTPVAFFLLFFAIAWNAFLVVWYSIAAGGDGPDGAFRVLMLVFPLAHVAVGIGVAYFTAALFLNRTTLTVDQHELAIVHQPLPWWPSPRIPVADLEQLFVKRNVSHNKNGGTSVSFELRAVTRDDKGRALIKSLTELDQALWLEQTVEKRVGIRDRAVAGEFRADEIQS